MNRLPGVGGTLFPGRYLAERLLADVPGNAVAVVSEQPRFARWWKDVVRVCGPASGIHAVFDLVAMPLFGRLGYRARHVAFEARAARALLSTAQGVRVGLHVLPWAERQPEPWRELAVAAHELGTAWWLVLAPPFLSLVDVRGHATRRSVEFRLPDALAPESFPVFRTLLAPAMFTPPGGAATSTRVAGLVYDAERFQAAVREDLQHGVRAALAALRPAVGRHDDLRQALTIVYRILFLLFAEARDVVPRFDPIYGPTYSIGSLCRQGRLDARGLWAAMGAVTRLARAGCRVDHLVVLPFNGRLFARESAPSLEPQRPVRLGRRVRARDRAMADALGSLGWRAGPGGHEEISYADLGVEQLGAVYERLLDLLPDDLQQTGHPRGRPAARVHSRIRKETGTFYTPQPLAEFVVRRTLAPLVAGATPERILALRVVDPAMGSGAFLVAACRYLALAYERALIDDGRAAATDFDDEERAAIRRLVAERCLVGVDSNPIAVQLARLSIWLTTLARGKPLGFLDHRLRVGNSLVGAFSSELGRIPAGSPRYGRDRLPLFDGAELESALQRAIPPLAALRERAEDDIGVVRAKERAWAELASPHSPLARWRRAADVWCARWFPRDAGLPPPTPAETRATIDAIVRGDRTLPATRLAARLRDAAEAAREHAFFHWDLEFADVFYDMAGRRRDHPGFDAVIGNPPWEMVRNGSADAHSRPHELVRSHPPAGQFVRFVRESGVYPSCDRGHVNLYQPFVERAIRLARSGGRVGLVVPWGLASDDGAAALRRMLLEQAGLHTLVGLDNAKGLFPIHRGLRFLAAVFEPGRPAGAIRARFGVSTAEEIDALPELEDGTTPTAYPIRLTPAAIAACGTRTLRVPDARSVSDLALLSELARRWPPLGSQDGWRAEFGRELNATEDAVHFGPAGLPVIDGKHLEPFRARVSESCRRVAPETAARLLADGRYHEARLAYRDVAGARNKWTVIAAIVPRDVLTTHTVYCLRTAVAPAAMDFLCAVLNSYVVNAIVRLLMGGHVTTSLVESLPVPPWTGGLAGRRIARLSRRLRLGLARADTEPRLQAEVARAYGLDAAAFRRLLEGFPLVDPAARGRATAIIEAAEPAGNHRGPSSRPRPASSGNA